MSVSTTRFNGVLTLTLNNPTRANALSPTMVAELIKELDKAEKDDDVRVLVLTGEGLFFSAGMDLAAASKGSGAPFDTALSIFKRIADSQNQQVIIDYIYYPMFARINGPALGGGVGLVFATDFRIAIDSSFIQLAEVKRGLIPAIISLYIVPQLGPSLSRAFFLTGEKVPIQRLHQAGIIYSIATSPTHLDESVSSLAALLIEGGPQLNRQSNSLFVSCLVQSLKTLK
ncbi:ClpP/crotonase [Rhizoclosmatium globosum]|uniref:ClpP/crotonase n=1 Tax=Rhizoclosmatium globosum TaxID=329046 RepID=A0A1Y2BQL0_9FUNG|nr:ClpP/crotonase [Rhizoclosmatium globosum]|eukprot:ORY37031.1 ClpP/crotonase [Rhizoclosmatium globosum]